MKTSVAYFKKQCGASEYFCWLGTARVIAIACFLGWLKFTISVENTVRLMENPLATPSPALTEYWIHGKAGARHVIFRPRVAGVINQLLALIGAFA